MSIDAHAHVRQCLFEVIANNGAQLSFATMDDGGCAVMCDGDILETYETDDAALTRAIKNYFRLVEYCGGSRHPFQAVDDGEPHPHDA